MMWTGSRSRASRSLVSIVAWRIVLFAGIAMAAQLAAVLVEYLHDPENLARLLMEKESAELAEGLKLHNGRLGYELPHDLRSRYDKQGSGYIARVRTQSGVILFSHCDELCTERFLPLELDPPTFWLRMKTPGLPLSFAGGHTFDVGGRRIFIEMAIDDDPQNAVVEVLVNEAIDHMLLPMTLTLIFVLGATILSIRTALEPVRRAAADADALDPMDSRAELATAGMPREIEQLAGAVNRSYERIRELIKSQKLFTSAIAHEIRTPLAVLVLELERIDHSRARRAVAEVEELARFVDDVVALARLEAIDAANLVTVDLNALAEEIVASIANWVYERGATIGFEPGDATLVSGHPALLKDAIRNLIENAVRHGGPGVAILVSTDGHGGVMVDDDGIGSDITPAAGAAPQYKRSGGLGIGLEIVRRIAALHGGRFEFKPRQPKGTQAALHLPTVSYSATKEPAKAPTPAASAEA